MRLLDLSIRYVARVLHWPYNGCVSNERIGIRELKQNPSAIISRAEAGARFDVYKNGKPTGVVIRAEQPAKKRWLSGEEMAALTAGLGADRTGWLEDNEHLRDLSPLRDPWDERE